MPLQPPNGQTAYMASPKGEAVREADGWGGCFAATTR